ncbi:hypothetical protein NA56DRAFT_644986 [Hyaloscypha hepaticicola]|uniref:Uncharacterized protein n=1 Tax=Hyaloscypha hepaticicola TaxID=2082293 RepID=A0A2J6Q7N9_9HELO|nr:hypothetical protein NA56DRAFT_644986 [Hyaloscypha hepaticicola]
MCIAVDRSGSTIGTTIKTECNVVRELCHLRRDLNQSPVKLLPWCDTAYAPITLHDARTGLRKNLDAGGGTDPAVLFKSEACLEALRAAGIWVLMTDGQIFDSLVENFATRTAEVGLHNKACIVIVFGDASSGRPATCDISVGIAIYAVVPDCLFLFHDIPTGIVRIMQAKGRLRKLLPFVAGLGRRIKLVVSQYTAWAELPRTSYEDIFNIEISTIRNLEPDEMALQDGLIINLPDMLAGRMDEATIEQIIKDRDNLRSVALASKTRGTGKDLADWLRGQQKAVPAKSTMPQDIDNRAYKSITDLLKALRTNTPEEKLEELRQQVRTAHESNLDDFWGNKARDEESESEIQRRNIRLETHAAAIDSKDKDDERQSRYTIGKSGYSSERRGATPRARWRAEPSRDLEKSTPIYTSYDQDSGAAAPAEPENSASPVRPEPLTGSSSAYIPAEPTGYEPHSQPQSEYSEYMTKPKKSSKQEVFAVMRRWRRKKKSSQSKEGWSERSSVTSQLGDDLDPVLLPGFRRRIPVEEFTGCCMLCNSISVLTLLLKSPPPATTSGFPEEGKYAKIAYPLAMGHFVEVDVISFFLTCDACAYHLLQIGTCPTSEIIIGALCLVCLSENQAPWLEAVDQAVKGRFDIGDLMAIFFAIINGKMVENETRDASLVEKNLFRECADWTLRSLASILDVPTTLSPALSDGQMALTTPLVQMIVTNHFSDPGHSDNKELLLLRYPMAGFMVILKLLCLNNLSPEQARILVFQKIIFQVIEQYMTMRRSAKRPLPAEAILGLNTKPQQAVDTNDSNSILSSMKTSISVSELVQFGLLDGESLKRLQDGEQVEIIKSRGGPAMAVFLHQLFRHGHEYFTATECFNAFKVQPSMTNMMLAPLGIGPGLAADLISQL